MKVGDIIEQPCKQHQSFSCPSCKSKSLDLKTNTHRICKECNFEFEFKLFDNGDYHKNGKYLIEIIKLSQQETKNVEAKLCGCDMTSLMRYGCKCGGV
jgi:ribosomal protein L37AE/L43A